MVYKLLTVQFILTGESERILGISKIFNLHSYILKAIVFADKGIPFLFREKCVSFLKFKFFYWFSFQHQVIEKRLEIATGVEYSFESWAIKFRSRVFLGQENGDELGIPSEVTIIIDMVIGVEEFFSNLRNLEQFCIYDSKKVVLLKIWRFAFFYLFSAREKI